MMHQLCLNHTPISEHFIRHAEERENKKTRTCFTFSSVEPSDPKRPKKPAYSDHQTTVQPRMKASFFRPFKCVAIGSLWPPAASLLTQHSPTFKLLIAKLNGLGKLPKALGAIAFNAG